MLRATGSMFSEKLCRVPTWRPWQQWGLWGLREGQPELLPQPVTAGSSRTQPVPASHSRFQLDEAGSSQIPQGAAEPRPGQGHRRVCVCKEGQKRCTKGGEEKTDETKNLVNSKLRTERGGGAAPGPGAEIPLQPVEEPVVTQVGIPAACGGTMVSVHGGHHWEQVHVF